MHYWAAIIDARDPTGSQDCNDARGGTHRIQVERDDACMRLGAAAQRGMKRTARLDDVVDVRRCAGDVQMRTLVRKRIADERCPQCTRRSVIHGVT